MSTENNGENKHGSYQERKERFDYLMDRYMTQKASEKEKEELRQWVENGFGSRFQEWFDKSYHTDTGTEAVPEEIRLEILTNILGQVPHRKTGMSGTAWKWAVAVVLIIGAAVWFMAGSDYQVKEMLTEYPSENRKAGQVVLKGKQFLYLPDGSSVLMNEGSELSYTPGSFESGPREVTLKGEAYFNITHHPENAFRVRAGSVVTRVLGTAFNVNMKEKEVTVTVTRGLVEVSDKGKVYAKVRPDEQITVNTETHNYNTVSVSAEEEIAWKNAYLVFDNIDLKEAARLIRSHYGVELHFTDTSLMQCHITASFLNEEALDTVLKVITAMNGASYKVEGDSVWIEGGSCS